MPEMQEHFPAGAWMAERRKTTGGALVVQVGMPELQEQIPARQGWNAVKAGANSGVAAGACSRGAESCSGQEIAATLTTGLSIGSGISCFDDEFC